jgi:predicted metal-dependent HD superfamily phosphohydrolase
LAEPRLAQRHGRANDGGMELMPFPLPQGQWAALEAAYATPLRAYHNLGHVQSLLHHYRDVAAGPGWQQPREVALAALYHDAIYDVGKRDNEARSAQLAIAEIERWIPGQGIDTARVAGLIELTARHGQLTAEELDADAALFLDSDMAILGAPAEVFDAYDRGIAEEYRNVVPGFLFRLNRRRFLRGVLKQPRIFFSEFFHNKLDGTARANLRRVTGG